MRLVASFCTVLLLLGKRGGRVSTKKNAWEVVKPTRRLSFSFFWAQ